MIQRIDLRGTTPSRADLLHLVPRAQTDVSDAVGVASGLVADVRDRGTAALLEQAERFDGVRPENIRIHSREIAAALAGLDPAVRAALEEAVDRVSRATRAQLPPSTVTTIADGAEIIQRWRPVSRVGLYIPGGKAVYPSSVVMNVVPAQVAGVADLAIASPPQRAFDGAIHPTVLAAAGLLGIDEVYAMGGAGAIGAFAYGVPELSLDPVQVVTGPGNRFVAAAKRVVTGVVGIDSEAGPTEILVIADGTADARYVAADLLSQAEHDEVAAAVLVTDSEPFAEAVSAELERIAPATRHAARVAEALSGRQSAVVLVDDLVAAAEFSNVYAPEHLEIQTEEPGRVLDLIENAGVVFLGENAPVSLGDYLAGSNHVLPTSGTARFSAALGAYTFLRAQQVVRYSRTALEGVADHVVALAEAEDLPAHGAAVAERFRTR